MEIFRMRAREGSLRGPKRAENGPKWPKWQNMTKIMSPFWFFSSTNQAGYMAIQIVCWWAGVVINGPYISINGLFLFEQVLCHITCHSHSESPQKYWEIKNFAKKRVNYLPIMNNLRVSSQSMWKFKGYIDV